MKMVSQVSQVSRFPQILEYQSDLLGCKEALFGAIPRLFQSCAERFVQFDPQSQAIQGRTGCQIRCISLCQLSFIIGAYPPFLFFFRFHIFSF